MTPTFDDVVAQELPGLLRYATALCGDADQARDLVQDVLVRAYTRWHRIRETDRPAAYLNRMVTNEFVSWRRRWATRSIIVVPDDDLARAAPPGADLGTAVVERDDLERRLSRLPRRQQVALVLRYYEGLDYAEAADILDCAEGTVRSLCSRGLAALRIDESDPVLTTKGLR